MISGKIAWKAAQYSLVFTVIISSKIAWKAAVRLSLLDYLHYKAPGDARAENAAAKTKEHWVSEASYTKAT